MWLAKLKAFSLHFVVTALVAVLAAWLVFGLWYPHPYAQMMGGMKLFLLVVGCDLVLGPLVSLVIFNPKKKRKELMTDYAVVVAIQLAAIAYGLYVVAEARPAFLAFVADRYVVVSAGELPEVERAKAMRPEWRRPNWLGGVQTVYAMRPADAQTTYDLIVSAMGGGRDIQHVVENYRPVGEHVADILKAAKSLDDLRERHPDRTAAIASAVLEAQRPAANLRWLPVQAGTVFWTALIDVETGLPVAWVDVDPL
ncbi:TfpX/TfpZ family type IV pilin accessory protein [Ottowia sp.]|uniref:TfpX/TfpZ family type IV pilin accessory protein n=1 Tax=Ottowia sp. TaxID=1898956 RepID=UPI0026296EDC|nr:TfpX/TfpZ family type IV pilin accessory protein [Ottowia sp.]